MPVRAARADDIPALTEVVDGAGLFPGEMLPDMMGGYLNDPDSQDIWLACEVDGRAEGFCYAAPEKLTDGTWNMLAIAVRPGRQGQGLGAAIIARLEALLAERGQRILIADTSGTPEFERTRAFYRQNGYVEEACIRDFWGEGNDKVVFWKKLG